MSDNRSDYKILVVEDTPAMAQLTLLTLQRGGFQAVHVEDGETAIDFLTDKLPHLILLDLNLPGVSGWDVMQYVIKTHGTGKVPVIITTAYGDNANRVIGKLQDVHKYMVKPFKPLDLIATVEEALGLDPLHD
ncbi:MAG: response regulator [Chloroflexota bacterium]